MFRSISAARLGLLAALALSAAACGDVEAAAPDASAGDSPVAGMCHESQPDCIDTVVDSDGGDADALEEGALIQIAEALLGKTEAEATAAADVRIGRRGDEQFMLTEDYVIGRNTVALEDDGSGTFRVVEVTVELTDGPMVLGDG